MKVNRNLLYKMISEAMSEETMFQKLMRLVATDYEHAKQAMDLVDFVDLSPEEDEQLRQAYVSAIVKGSDNPGRDLKEIDFDFHQVFVDAYGFPPPMDKEFTLWDENPKAPLSLRTTVYGEPIQTDQRVGHDVEFEFWFDYDQKVDGMIVEPWFRYETLHGKDGYVVFENGVIRIDEDEEYSEEISKEQLPSAVRSAMGIPWDADVSGWPELPKGQPPAEGSNVQGPDDPPYEGKRKLNKNYLFEVINEVLQEDEGDSAKESYDAIISMLDNEDFSFAEQGMELYHSLADEEDFTPRQKAAIQEKWDNWALRRIQSNDPEAVLQGLEIYREEKKGWPPVPHIIDSYAKGGSTFDYLFMAVKNQEDAKALKEFFHRYRTIALSRPKQDKRGSKVYWFAASVRQQQGNWMMKEKEYADWIAGFSQDYARGGIWNGAYIVEILLDMPEKGTLQESLIYEDEEDDNYAMIAAKVKKFIGSKDFEFYKQAFHLIDVYDMSDLISQEEANGLRERIFYAAFEYKIASDNLDEMKEMIDEFRGLPEEKRLDMEWDIYYHLSFLKSLEEAVKYAVRDFDVKVIAIDPVALLALEGEPKELEKAKARLRRFAEEEELFAPAPKPGLLLFGSLAENYVNFHKEIEEIFGATPRGAIDVGSDGLSLLLRTELRKPFKAALTKGNLVTGNVAFEWSAELGYGIEITLYPAKLPNMPSQLLDDYYGIWISPWEEGPNIGKLEIGMQSYEEEFERNTTFRTEDGQAGFTIEEMHKEIHKLTGIDLNALN